GAALGGRGSQTRRDPCPPAGRPVERNRAPQIGGRRAYNSAAANCGQRAARMEIGLPEGRIRLGVPQWGWPVEDSSNIIQRAWIPTQIAAGVTRQGRGKKSGLDTVGHFYGSWEYERRLGGGMVTAIKMRRTRI